MNPLKSIFFAVLFLSGSSLFAQTYTSYFTGNPVDIVTTPTGGSVLMGGATESDDAMRWFLQRANGGDVLVLRASGSDGYNDYLYTELGITVNSVESIVFNEASAASEVYIHDKIAKAEAIWFAGGDQWKYVSYWRDTTIMTLLNEAINNRDVVIGGTSAGMAIMGGHYFTAQNGTITSSSALANPYHPRATVSSEPFLEIDYLSDIITDTHYDDPDRRGRHTTFLARIMTDTGIAARGIACDEYTAVCIDPAGIARVYGDFPSSNDNAYFIMSNCELEDVTPEVCVINTPLRWNRGGMALKAYRVKGTVDGLNTFDLNDWTTGVGGTWEDWSVNDGVFSAIASTAVTCNPLNVAQVNKVQLSLYPNPTTNWVYLQSTKGLIELEVYDISGRKHSIQLENYGSLKRFSTQHLYDGSYFLRLSLDDQSTIVKRLIKQSN
jgi:cyanophycinase-like exopeptidase